MLKVRSKCKIISECAKLTSSRFQKLQLEHVQDFGCQGAMEFR
jgi:hypothetical protein